MRLQFKHLPRGDINGQVDGPRWEFFEGPGPPQLGSGKIGNVQKGKDAESRHLKRICTNYLTESVAVACSFFGVFLSSNPTSHPIDTHPSHVLLKPIERPGILRTVYGDHERFLSSYLKVYDGYYLTGDCAIRDQDGDYQILGRSDDVINKAGHRLGTAEIESALVASGSCIEAAVTSIPHDVFGEEIWAFCILPQDKQPSQQIVKSLKNKVATEIGKFATPDRFVLTQSLPKTRSGKIMRRLLRNIALGKTDPKDLGDTSTLSEHNVLEELMQAERFQG
eukprot:TRINITY_DN2601_c0_g1_i2.p1 TRINITY_DN2601_c0_g1~~TRINITY_DN2601_c0_g1_i2.p1  ORF type:complete len:280 (+),score=68.91 TRINITY_DN2601_c0_g1_i2:269-1108(+)